jgi:hypothetical protein
MSDKVDQFAFPKGNIPESEKNEEWHKDFVLAIVNQSIDTAFDLEYASMNESVEFFNGLQTGDEFQFLQEAEDGEVLPAQWINFNKIRSRIDILLGELQAKTYQINARSINKDAKARKLLAKETARVQMRLSGEREFFEEQYGLPLAKEGAIPRNEDELDDLFGYNFKEKNEIIMEYALRWLAKRYKWSYLRLAMFRDMLVQGKAFCKLEVVNGLPIFRRIDPRFMVYDTNATDDFLSDSTFFGEVRYMSMADAVVKYNLSKKEVKKLYEAFGAYQNLAKNPGTAFYQFNALNGSTLNWFKVEGNDLRILCVEAVWQDYKILKHKSSVDKYGGEHVKEMPDTAKNGDLITNNLSIWRQGTLLGGTVLKKWGEMKNMVRENDALAETKSPYKAVIPHYLNGRGISKVDQVKGLQKLQDVTMYNIQLAMSRAGAKGFIYDVSQVPEGWDIHNVIKYLKTAGIAFIDSKKDGIPATHNQFQSIDQTLSQSVQQYLAISAMLEEQIDRITGINAARQGQVEGQSQAVGVTQSALMQSTLATNIYFSLLNEHANNIFNYMAGLVKMTFAGNERYAPIIGDVGVNFLEETVDLEFDDYGIFLEETPPMLADLQNFQAIVQAALQAGQISFVDAVKLLSEKDVTIAIRRFEKAVEQKEREMMERQNQMMMQQAQAAQQQQMAEMEGEMAKIDKKGQYDLQKQMLENEGELDEAITTGRMGLTKEKIDFTKKAALEKIKANMAARQADANTKLSNKITKE